METFEESKGHPILSSKARERLVIDLVDVQKFREENEGFGWILTLPMRKVSTATLGRYWNEGNELREEVATATVPNS